MANTTTGWWKPVYARRRPGREKGCTPWQKQNRGGGVSFHDNLDRDSDGAGRPEESPIHSAGEPGRENLREADMLVSEEEMMSNNEYPARSGSCKSCEDFAYPLVMSNRGLGTDGGVHNG